MGILFNFCGFYDEILTFLKPGFADDPRVFELMAIWGTHAKERWPVGVI